MIIDSHCHLDYSNLYDQLDKVIERAESNNIKYFLTICTTLKSFDRIKLIIKKYKNIFGTFGIHPHETKNHQSIEYKTILNNAKKNNKVIGIGETGLDFHYTHSDRKIQETAFIEHIKAASELNIPLIVHTRNAEKETYEILKSENKNYKLKVLMHCFTGTKDFAKKLIDINCHISFSGIITFKNSADLVDTARSIPIENLLVETDSPYLSPEPLRGKVNEPSHIIHTVDKLSQIKNVSKNDLMHYTTNNFIKLFNLNI